MIDLASIQLGYREALDAARYGDSAILAALLIHGKPVPDELKHEVFWAIVNGPRTEPGVPGRRRGIPVEREEWVRKVFKALTDPGLDEPGARPLKQLAARRAIAKALGVDESTLRNFLKGTHTYRQHGGPSLLDQWIADKSREIRRVYSRKI